jgi:hypothetical protein
MTKIFLVGAGLPANLPDHSDIAVRGQARLCPVGAPTHWFRLGRVGEGCIQHHDYPG